LRAGRLAIDYNSPRRRRESVANERRVTARTSRAVRETDMTKLRVLLRDLALSSLLVGLLIAPALTAPETPAPVATAALQAPAGRGGAPAPQVTSPEVGADRRVTFRI